MGVACLKATQGPSPPVPGGHPTGPSVTWLSGGTFVSWVTVSLVTVISRFFVLMRLRSWAVSADALPFYVLVCWFVSLSWRVLCLFWVQLRCLSLWNLQAVSVASDVSYVSSLPAPLHAF